MRGKTNRNRSQSAHRKEPEKRRERQSISEKPLGRTTSREGKRGSLRSNRRSSRDGGRNQHGFIYLMLTQSGCGKILGVLEKTQTRFRGGHSRGNKGSTELGDSGQTVSTSEKVRKEAHLYCGGIGGPSSGKLTLFWGASVIK